MLNSMKTFVVIAVALICPLASFDLWGDSDDDDYGVDANSFLSNPRLLGVIHVDEDIFGQTVLGTQLFVVRGTFTKEIKVYDTNSLTFTREIPIPGSIVLRGIVASARCNCLCISDASRNVVYRYNLSDNVVSNWSVGGSSYGLSLTSNHNILVTLDLERQIKEYTLDGSLVRVISLDSSVAYPWHSVQLSNGHIVVSNGKLWSHVKHRVCIVDTSGRIIRCYGGSKGSGSQLFSFPTSLAVDIRDNVLVADNGNNRVLLFDSSLTRLGEIAIPGHKLVNPWALHLDHLNRRLYIGEENDSGRVLVLTV